MPTTGPTIGFIGGGNMARSLIGGLITADIDRTDITVAEPGEQQRQSLEKDYAIKTSSENNTVAACDIIILAVKPQVLKTVCQQLQINQQNSPLFISIAAGVKSTDINRWLSQNSASHNNAIVRCMPNTPSLVQCGASGLYANDKVSELQRQHAENIMKAVGIIIWVNDEEQLNAVTAVSGSGPAYFFLMMEAMQQAGESLGLSADVSKKLVLQTALGAARMAIESDVTTAELRKNVTSKGGTTEQAILSFQSENFQQTVLNALTAARDRSITLADELGSE